jgi:RNA polymerase sigma factor (sigma-70 family)
LEIKTTLWEQVAGGNEHSYAELFRIYYKKLFNYGKKFTEDETLIEDSAQETFVIVWQKRTQLKEVEFPVTYMYSVFRNTLFARLKTNQRYITGADIQDDPEFAVDQMIIRNETDAATAQKLQHALNALTSRQREAIFLRFYEGLPYDEVAQMLGITTKATYKIMARALDELRQQLQISGGMLLFLLAEMRR